MYIYYIYTDNIQLLNIYIVIVNHQLYNRKPLDNIIYKTSVCTLKWTYKKKNPYQVCDKYNNRKKNGFKLSSQSLNHNTIWTIWLRRPVDFTTIIISPPHNLSLYPILSYNDDGTNRYKIYFYKSQKKLLVTLYTSFILFNAFYLLFLFRKR